MKKTLLLILIGSISPLVSNCSHGKQTSTNSPITQTKQTTIDVPKSVVGKTISISFDQTKVLEYGEWKEWSSPTHDIEFCLSWNSDSHTFKSGNISTDKGGRYGPLKFHYKYIGGNNSVLEWYSPREKLKRSILLTFTSPNTATGQQQIGPYEEIKNIKITIH